MEKQDLTLWLPMIRYGAAMAQQIDDWLTGEREASRQIEAGETDFYEDEEALERAFQERI